MKKMKSKTIKMISVITVIALLICGMPFALNAVSSIKTVDVAAVNGFINSGYDTEGYEAYDASNTEHSFNMDGRTYVQGFTLKGKYYNSTSKVSFNVENIDSFSFTVGHIDNCGGQDSTLGIYRDGEWWQNVELTVNSVSRSVELDVSKVKVIRFDIHSLVAYGFADITVDGKTGVAAATPEYGDVNELMTSAYDMEGYKMFDGTNEHSGFNMCGRTYIQGFTMSGQYYNSTSQVSFNVENINSFSFAVGHLDESWGEESVLQIFRDGEWWQNVDLTLHSTTQTITLDVSKIKTLRFFIDNKIYYGFAEITIDGKESLPASVPEYGEVNDFTGKAYNREGYEVFDGSNEFANFNMCGRTYIQGFTLMGEYYNSTSQVSFNVENVNSVSFTVGHIDDKWRENAVMKVYRDGEWWQDIDLTVHGLTKTVTLDVSKNKTLRLFIEGKVAYGFADITVDGNTSLGGIVPGYNEVNDLIERAYDKDGCDVYDGSNEFTNFKMSGKTFIQGVTLCGPYYNSSSQVTFNTENLGRLNFCLGHLDDKEGNNGELAIILDGEEYYRIPLATDQPSKYYTISLSDVKTLRLLIGGQIYYGFGDITLNDEYAEGKSKSDYIDINQLWLEEHPGAATEPATEEPEQPATEPLVDENLISAGSVTAKPGDTVTIPVKVDKNTHGIVDGWLFIGYDDSVMTLTEVKDGGLLSGAELSADTSANPCCLVWRNDTPSDNNYGTGVIAYLTFKINSAAPAGTYSVTPDSNASSHFYDLDANETFFSYTAGAVTVESKGTTPPATEPAQPQYIKGDLNDDGKVDSRDRIILTRHLAKWKGYETL